MTSNAGAQKIMEPKNLGFAAEHSDEADYKVMKEAVMNEVRHLFKPEFINRIDEIIVFASLTKEDMKGIAEIMLKEITQRAKEQAGVEIRVTDAAKERLVEKGFDRKYGARALKRTIQTDFEDRLAEEIISGNIKGGDKIRADVNKDGTLMFKVTKKNQKKI